MASSSSFQHTEDHTGTKSTHTRKRRLYESRREREFYSYYESVLAYSSTEPKFCDLNCPEAAAKHTAVSPANTILTAFTQLAALRIGTRRAMVFFFDADHAYVIAESTRTLSLRDDSHHAPGDSLWLGFTKIPRGLSVCEVTADLPANEGSNAQDPNTKTIAHIVNNLAEDTRFCDRPYVQGGPKARFYAGVPITTPSGINIGVLCVLDDKPRDGLEDDQVEFLRNLAATIMSHLELVRAKEDNQRSHDMNTALGAFVEGKLDSRDWWHHNAHSSPDAPSHPTAKRNEPRIKTFDNRVPTTPQATDPELNHSALAEVFASNSSLRTTEAVGSTPAEIPPSHGSPSDKHPALETVASSKPTLRLRDGSDGSINSIVPSHTVDDTPEEDLSTRIKATAARAAGLIQRGVCADGVLFLDATVGSFGGLINGMQGLSQTETETDGSPVSEIGDITQQKHRQEQQPAPTVKLTEQPKHSVVLGSAYSTDIESRVKEAIEQAKFSEKVLRSLLRRYPDGQIWHFNSDGDASDEDGCLSDEGLSSTSAGESAGSGIERDTTPSSKRAARRTRARKKDGRAIQEIFPGIRSLIFLGMWDPCQERWFGASIVLSYSSTRIFSVRNELSYLAAFCDVVLGEIWRLETQELGRSKNAFISSISHELRSPLHGILGSAECLEEQEQSALSRELIRSISSCGNTLLDVINDLLEYSRLDRGPDKRRRMNLSKTANPFPDAHPADVSEVESGVMVNTLTEDAINAACLGFDLQRIKDNGLNGASNEHSAVLTLNIEAARDSDWLFSVASGSWKRICLNLVLNALKYTPCGYISVTLRKKWRQQRADREGSALVELVVEDSGIGMSKEFQVRSLFRPFKQENSLTPGTGLGLNLVARIVKSLGGTIYVRSSKGVGTTFRVSLPLRRPLGPPMGTTAISLAPSTFSGGVEFLGFGVSETNSIIEPLELEANKRLLGSLKRSCRQLGLSVCATDGTLDNNASIQIIREQGVERSSQTKKEGVRRSLLTKDQLRRPVIVICTTRDSAFKLRSTPISTSLPSGTQYLWLPIGPAKLADAISTLVDSRTDNEFGAVALDDMQPSSSKPGKEMNQPAQIAPSSKGGRTAADASKDGAIPTIGPINAETNHEEFQVPQLPRTRRSGSEAIMSSSTPSLQLRTQINRAITAPCHRSGTLSLLLVDDNAVNLRLLEMFAKQAGHVYSTARNGREAVEAYESAARKNHRSDDSSTSDHGQSYLSATKPEVVLMDINMPVMDGFEAARAIRRFEHASGNLRAAIIAITGLGDTSAQEEAFTSGIDLFLTKPVKMKELTNILAKLQGAGA